MIQKEVKNKMKFDNNIPEILKNFATINKNMWFRKDGRQTTVSKSKTFMAVAKVDFDIDEEFGIFDLGQFLNVLSLYKKLDIEVESRRLKILGDSVFNVNYTTSPKELLIISDKTADIKSVYVDFTLPIEVFNTAKKNADLMQLPNFVIKIKDGVLSIVSTNVSNPDAHNFEYELDKDLKLDNISFTYEYENMQMLPRQYKVSISEKGLTKFEADDIEYFIASKVGK